MDQLISVMCMLVWLLNLAFFRDKLNNTTIVEFVLTILRDELSTIMCVLVIHMAKTSWKKSNSTDQESKASIPASSSELPARPRKTAWVTRGSLKGGAPVLEAPPTIPKALRERLTRTILVPTAFKQLVHLLRRGKSQPMSTSPANNLDIPPCAVINSPHSVHIASPHDPPPSHVLAEINRTGQIVAYSKPGILVCECKQPTNPPPESKANLYLWEDLSVGKIPSLMSREHFVASDILFLEETGHKNTLVFVRLPLDASLTRKLPENILINLSQALNSLDSNDEATSTQMTEDQIYLRLLQPKKPATNIQVSDPPQRAEFNPYQTQTQYFECRWCPALFSTYQQLITHESDEHTPTPKLSTKKSKRKHRISTTGYSSSSTDSSTDSSSSTSSPDPNNRQHSLYVTPSIILEEGCPDKYHVFWNLRATDKKKCFVAPHFTRSIEPAEVTLGFPNIAQKEFLCWAKAYTDLSARHSVGRIENTKLKLGVRNTLQYLQEKGRRQIIEVIRLNAPVLPQQRLTELTTQGVTQFFSELRCYTLQSAIEWSSFFTFTFTSRTVGDEVYNKVLTSLAAHPSLKSFSMQLSSYIEFLVLRLVPTQEQFCLKFEDYLHTHVARLSSAYPSAEFLKINLDVHSQELSFIHPYCGAQKFLTDGVGVSSDKQKLISEVISYDLLHQILHKTSYASKLSMIYIGRDSFQNITEVPKSQIIHDLSQMITTEQEQQRAIRHVSAVEAQEEEGKDSFTDQEEEYEQAPKGVEETGEEYVDYYKCFFCSYCAEASYVYTHMKTKHPCSRNFPYPPPAPEYTEKPAEGDTEDEEYEQQNEVGKEKEGEDESESDVEDESESDYEEQGQNVECLFCPFSDANYPAIMQHMLYCDQVPYQPDLDASCPPPDYMPEYAPLPK